MEDDTIWLDSMCVDGVAMWKDVESPLFGPGCWIDMNDTGWGTVGGGREEVRVRREEREEDPAADNGEGGCGYSGVFDLGGVIFPRNAKRRSKEEEVPPIGVKRSLIKPAEVLLLLLIRERFFYAWISGSLYLRVFLQRMPNKPGNASKKKQA
ncbi:hypothetical protein Tco_1204801 [Tanacetum coccineum]